MKFTGSRLTKDIFSMYGWVAVLIVLLFGILFYFGSVDPSILLSEYCRFGGEMYCLDSSVSNTNGIFLLLRNDVGSQVVMRREDLSLELANGRKMNWGNCLLNDQEVVTVPRKGLVEISCKELLDVAPGERMQVDVVVKYIKHTYQHPVKGEIHGTVE